MTASYGRKRLTLLVAAAMLVLAAGHATAALRAVEQAYELGLGDLTLPGNEAGYLMARLCPRCRPEVLRVDAATRYLVRPSATPVSLAEFRAQAKRALQVAANQGFCYVYYDPKTRHVRRLVLDAANSGSRP